MTHMIVIRALDQGWTLQTDRLDAPMVFRSGAQAERAGRDLVRRLADAGEPAELAIYLRDGALAARFVGATAQP